MPSDARACYVMPLITSHLPRVWLDIVTVTIVEVDAAADVVDVTIAPFSCCVSR